MTECLYLYLVVEWKWEWKWQSEWQKGARGGRCEWAAIGCSEFIVIKVDGACVECRVRSAECEPRLRIEL